jgi:hypothetical protein
VAFAYEVVLIEEADAWKDGDACMGEVVPMLKVILTIALVSDISIISVVGVGKIYLYLL